MSVEEKNNWGADKIARYKWTMRDEPGTFKYIHKNDIAIDHTYQRLVTSSKVLNMARDWSWVAAGVISVAIRDGKYYALDGQNRILASRHRSDIDKLPCQVFTLSGVSAEAAGFLACNTNRKPITSVDRHKAKVVTGDRAALLVDLLVSMSGRTIINRSDAQSVHCLTTLNKWAGTHPDVLQRIWPLIVVLCAGQPLPATLVDGLMYIELGLGDMDSITNSKWHTRLCDVGYSTLMQGAQKAAAFYTTGGARVWALGMLESINKGLRNRLTLCTGAEDAP